MASSAGMLFGACRYRAGMNTSPLFNLYQEWATGLFLLKAWYNGSVMARARPVGDSWRARFEDILQPGLTRMDVRKATVQIIW